MMKMLKRWTTSVVASFDSMITQVENHEALVNAAIREVQEAGARAKVQLSRVKQDGAAMRRKLAELRTQKEAWRDRAIRSAGQDEQRALECLRRKKRLDHEIGELETQEREHAKIEKQLSADLTLIDERLTRLKQQRNLLRTRQSRAEALRTLQNDDSAIISEIDDIFERWEVKVSEYEASGVGHAAVRDELEEEFVNAEETAELRDTLTRLLEENSAIKQ